MKSRMNWKRGLKRLWLLAAIPWMIYAFGEHDAAREIGNAWRYYTDHEALLNQQPTTTSNPYDDLIKQDEARQTGAAQSVVAPQDHLDELMDDYARRQTGEIRANATQTSDSNPDEIARQKRIAKSLGIPLAAVEADPEFATREQRTRSIEQATASSPALRQKFSDADFAKLAQGIHEPNFDWVIPVLLLPTFGVAFAALALWLAFLTLRWAWRGFQP